MTESNQDELPPGWASTEIGTILTFHYGKGLPEARRRAGSVPVYGSNGCVGFHDEPLVKGPVIVVGRKGTVGAVHLEANPCWPIDTTYYITDFTGLDPRFATYQLRHLKLGQFEKSTAIPGIGRDDVYLPNGASSIRKLNRRLTCSSGSSPNVAGDGRRNSFVGSKRKTATRRKTGRRDIRSQLRLTQPTCRCCRRDGVGRTPNRFAISLRRVRPHPVKTLLKQPAMYRLLRSNIFQARARSGFSRRPRLLRGRYTRASWSDQRLFLATC
jgi:hypothetical protein